MTEPYERRRPADHKIWHLKPPRRPIWKILIIAGFIAACWLPLALLIWVVG